MERLFEEYDVCGHEETWGDLFRLQRDGAYPARFARIDAPVMILCGALDRHHGPMIRDNLRCMSLSVNTLKVVSGHEVKGALLARFRVLLADLAGNSST